MYTHTHIHFLISKPRKISENLSSANKDVREARGIFVTLKYSYRLTGFATACVMYSNTRWARVRGSGRTKQEKFIVLRGVNTMFRASWQRRVADNVAGLHAETVAL